MQNNIEQHQYNLIVRKKQKGKSGIQKHRQYCVHKTQDEDKQSIDTDNTGYTRHRTKIDNP
jgi:hypothetical protein